MWNKIYKFWFILGLLCIFVNRPGVGYGQPESSVKNEPSSRDAQTSVNVKSLYQEAIRLYETRKYEEAKSKFYQLEEARKGYKATQKYLKKIEKAQQEELRKNAVAARSEKEDRKRKGSSERKKEKVAQKEQAVRQKELIRQTKVKYQELMALYKARRFDFAKDKVREFHEWLGTTYGIPKNYRLKMKGKIDKVEDRIEMREQKEAEKEIAREEKTTRIEQQKQKREDGLVKTEQEVRKKRKQVERSIFDQRDKIEAERSRVRKELSRRVNGLYTNSLDLFNEGQYEQALDILEVVERLWPDYKLTRQYLDKISRELKGLPDLDESPAQGKKDTAEKSRDEIIADALNALQRKLEQN